MLKGIDPILTPDLLHIIALMGHGDVLAVVDRNYPAHQAGRPVVHLAGVDTTEAARALFSLLPLYTFIAEPIARMEIVDRPREWTPGQREFVEAAISAEGREIEVESVERFAFYERARNAFAIVATTDDRPYGCFLITKGVI